MNSRFNFFLTAMAAVLLIGGCDDDEGNSKAVVPSNLEISTNIDGADVEVIATAKDAKYFAISFGDGTTKQSEDGTESHTYANSGTYTITVSAHSSPGDLITAKTDVSVTVPISDEGYESPVEREGYSLVWVEDFDGTSLNESIWNYEIGTGSGGWGNNELQYYRRENTTVADGYITITAKKESFSGQSYTSSRLTTQNKKEFTYGRIDIRARIPRGQGIWPALWMLGDNISTVGWPACGEIDIMEMIGGQGREKTVHGTVHWQSDQGYANYGGHKDLATGTYSDKFFVYSIEWDENLIKWYIDDVFFHQIDITPDHLSEFHLPQFFIMNVAVGGNWPGSPDATTVFPQQMVVDYIRVFQKP